MSKSNKKIRRDLSKFDALGNLWTNIKNNSLVKQIYVIKYPELSLKLYNKFRTHDKFSRNMFWARELGEMFVEAYADVSEYNDDAYFISVALGHPIERMNKSKLVQECERYEKG